MATVTTSIKDQARRLAELLPDNATWDDLKYKIFIVENIEASLRHCDPAKAVTQDEMRRMFGTNRLQPHHIVGSDHVSRRTSGL